MATHPSRRYTRRSTAFLALFFGTSLCLGILAPAAPAAGTGVTISSFTPTSGPAGTKVLIQGHGFAPSTVGRVTFGGVRAQFTLDSSTLVTATVPQMTASADPIEIFSKALPGARSSTDFAVVPGLVLSLATGPAGSVVKVSGSGFVPGEPTDIMFDSTVLTTVTAGAGGSIAPPVSITVPTSAAGGIHTISAHCSGLSAQAPFVVTSAIVTSPATGPPTSTVTVSGSGFGALEAVDIYFDTTDLALVDTNPSGSFGPISISVPNSAVPGTHWISAEGRHSGFAAQASFAVNTNWAQFRYAPKHKGSNPLENVLNRDNVSAIDQDWTFATGGQVTSSPAVTNGLLYVGSFDGHVYALNASTGTEKWSFFPEEVVRSSPAVANGLVYVGSDNSDLVALDASTGVVRWSFPVGSEFDSSPTMANGVVYLGTSGGKVYALNASSGTQLWSFTTGGFVRSSPAVANGVVYVGSDDGNLYALDASTGTELWSFHTGNGVVSAPAVANGVVYVGSEDGNVYALNASTGTQLWSHTTGAAIESSPAVANGMVYIGSNDRNLYALKASTGALLWSVITGSGIQSSPAVANGVVYVGSNDDNIYAFNSATGDQLWSFTTGSPVLSSPVVANGVVYVGSNDGNLYAFDLAGGMAAPARPSRSSLHANYHLRAQR